MVKCILVASPGFVKDQFITYLFKEAVRQDNKILLENRPKFMLVHSSSGHKYSLKGRSWWAVRIKQSNLIARWKTQWNVRCFCRNPLWSHCDKQALWHQGDHACSDLSACLIHHLLNKCWYYGNWYLCLTFRQQERWKPWKISIRCSSMSPTELSMGGWWWTASRQWPTEPSFILTDNQQPLYLRFLTDWLMWRKLLTPSPSIPCW